MAEDENMKNASTTGALLGPDRSGEYKKMGYRMPPQTVSAKEATDITNFLLTLPEST